jgi:polysaccharide export outer membrane protein
MSIASGNRFEPSDRSFLGWSFAGLLVCLLFLLNACQSKPEPVFASFKAGPIPQRDIRSSSYATNQLQEGDMVGITFQYFTNFNAVQKISLDGTLNLQQVGQVIAAGKTPLELQNELTRLYKPQIKEDSLTVKVMAAAASVYVGGAVNRPGKIPMERPLTPLEAIMEAGGFDPNRARLGDVTVLRLEGGKQETFHLNLKHVMQGSNPTPFYLKPFDIVHVPSKTFNF